MTSWVIAGVLKSSDVSGEAGPGGWSEQAAQKSAATSRA